MEQVTVEYWTRKHMPQILKLEGLMAKQENREAEKEEYFLSLLNEKGIVGCVVTVYDVVVGYMIYELWKTKLDIIEFVTYPQYAVGSVYLKMFDNLIKKCQDHNRETITTVLAETYVGKQMFLKGMGAKCVAIKKKYFASRNEDGYQFTFSVPKAEKTELDDELLEIV